MKFVARFWLKLSLQKKFLFTFITLMSLTLLMLSILASRLLHDEITKTIASEMKTSSTLTLVAIPLLQNTQHSLGDYRQVATLVDTLLQQNLRWASQFFLYDKDHKILAHSNSEPLQKNLNDILKGYDPKVLALQKILFQGKEWLAVTVPVKGTGEFFLLLVDAHEVHDEHYDLIMQLLLLAAAVLLVGGILVFWVTQALTHPFQHFQQQLKQITSTLDLSQRLKTSDQAELGDLATQTNSLLERLETAIKGVMGSSKTLTSTASRLALTAGLVGRNTDKHQEVSQSMAAAVEQMSSSIAEITSTMEELSASSTQISDHSQSVVEVANLALDSSKKGADAMQLLQLRMADINQDSVSSLQEIMQLGQKSKEISKVMDIINNLADQTKLIAFNAALEASSAGESGKRFSVVASEIRRLADSVTDSTHEIEDRVQEIQDSISRLVITSEKGASSIQLGMQVSSETAQDLNALVKASSRTSNAAQQISLSTKQQKTASDLNALVKAASRTSNAAQQISLSTQQPPDCWRFSVV